MMDGREGRWASKFGYLSIHKGLPQTPCCQMTHHSSPRAYWEMGARDKRESVIDTGIPEKRGTLWPLPVSQVGQVGMLI